jgi:hypothetical protein
MRRKIVINGDEWKIRSKKNLKDDKGNACYGLCEFSSKTIFIDSGIKNKKDFIGTLIHEVIHGVLFSVHIELDPIIEEAIAANIEKVFMQLFKIKLK